VEALVPTVQSVRVSRRFTYTAVLSAALAATAGCSDGRAVLTRQIDARRIASELRVSFAKANEAGSRAVLADTDDASTAAAREAADAEESAARALEELEPLLQSLGYRTELDSVARFRNRFEEFRKLDAEILPLATENSNLKAQRLVSEQGRDAAERFSAALAEGSGGPADVEWQKAAARAAVLEIQVLQSRHIAESDEDAMARIEARIDVLARDARDRLSRLRVAGTASPSGDLTAASQALDEFLSVNQQVIALSRRNTNVRSLALTLGRKRVVAAECEDELRVLQAALAGHGTEATR
jgi:hypothetical protein